MLIEQPVFCATFVVPTDKECELSVLMLLHELCILFSGGHYESINFTTEFQLEDTSADLRIPILDVSLGEEVTEDFTATSSVFSSVSVTPGNTYIHSYSFHRCW